MDACNSAKSEPLKKLCPWQFGEVRVGPFFLGFPNHGTFESPGTLGGFFKVILMVNIPLYMDSMGLKAHSAVLDP